MLSIRAALDKGMVVVVHSKTVPPMFFVDAFEHVRLSTVHVHSSASAQGDVLEDAIRHVLPASQAAYNRETMEQKGHGSFLRMPSLFKFRLNRKGVRYMVMEMLQVGFLVSLRPGAKASLVSVTSAYLQYCRLRYPEDDPAPITSTDVVSASRQFKEMYKSSIPDVVFVTDTASFAHLHTPDP
jgi:hypothetical protein